MGNDDGDHRFATRGCHLTPVRTGAGHADRCRSDRANSGVFAITYDRTLTVVEISLVLGHALEGRAATPLRAIGARLPILSP